MFFERIKLLFGLSNIYSEFLNAFETAPFRNNTEGARISLEKKSWKYLLKKFPARENL